MLHSGAFVSLGGGDPVSKLWAVQKKAIKATCAPSKLYYVVEPTLVIGSQVLSGESGYSSQLVTPSGTGLDNVKSHVSALP